MRIQTIAAFAVSVAVAAGCGGDDGDGGDEKGAATTAPKSEPQFTAKELRACLEREGAQVAGGGGLSGQGIQGRIPLIAVGSGGLESATNLLVFPSPDAARSFVEDPPPAASFVTVVSRTGNVVKARSEQQSGEPPPSRDEAAIDRCLAKR
jgi:hypothetical protein